MSDCVHYVCRAALISDKWRGRCTQLQDHSGPHSGLCVDQQLQGEFQHNYWTDDAEGAAYLLGKMSP